MQEEFSAKLTGRFVDDDDIVRTGRAMLEIDGFDMLHLPIPDGYKEQIDGLFGKASAEAEAAKKSANQAGVSAGEAKKSQTAAASSASGAASSASAAASSASKAEGSAAQAQTQAGAARSSANEAKLYSQQAGEMERAVSGLEKETRSSATKAAASEKNAATSEKNAASSASSAKADADRASKVAESTSWDGDKLTVNGKTSPPLTGPKGDTGPRGLKGDTGPRGLKGDTGLKGDKGEPGQDGSVKFEELTEEQKDLLRGPAGVVISETEPADKNVIWIQPGGEKFEVLGNSHTVMTDAEAEAVSEFLPKGFYIYVINSDRRYEVV